MFDLFRRNASDTPVGTMSNDVVDQGIGNDLPARESGIGTQLGGGIDFYIGDEFLGDYTLESDDSRPDMHFLSKPSFQLSADIEERRHIELQDLWKEDNALNSLFVGIAGVDFQAGDAGSHAINGDFVCAPGLGFLGSEGFQYGASDTQGSAATGDIGIVPTMSSLELSVSAIGTAPSCGEKQVSPQGVGSHQPSDIAGLADGGYVVAWTSNTGSSNGVWFQRYTATGVAIGDSVYASPQFKGTDVTIAARDDGGFTLAWAARSGPDTNYRYEIYARSFEADGSPMGPEFRVNQHLGGGIDKTTPEIAQLADGSLVATWSTGSAGNVTDISARRFAADGAMLGPEFGPAVNYDGIQYTSSVAALPNGGFFVTWASSHLPNSYSFDVIGRMFDAQGNAMSGEIVINTNMTYFCRQVETTVTALSDGSFVVAWQDQAADVGPFETWGITGRRFSADGTPLGGEFRINSTRIQMQVLPDIASLDDGGFVVVWQSSLQDGSAFGIFGQRFNASGAMVGSEFQVNSFTASDQVSAHVSGLENGGFVVSWNSYQQNGTEWSVHSQQFDANGDRLGPVDYYSNESVPLIVSVQLSNLDGSETLSILISGLPHGATLSAGSPDSSAVWTLAEADLANLRLLPPADYVGPVHLNVTAIATEISNGNQATTTQVVSFDIRDPLGVYGTDDANTLMGGSGIDRLYGMGGDDRLVGNAGNDILSGGSGSDTLTGGAGSDRFRFEAGTGSDRVTDFQRGPTGDLVDLVGTGISNYADVQAAMTQQGTDVVLDLGAGDQVRFMNTLLADFDATRFTYG